MLSFKTSGTEDENQETPAGGSRRVLTLILILVVALFAYLYFFTGLIKPRGGANKPAPVPAEVKKPIPPRPTGGEAQQAPAAGTPAAKPAPAPAGAPVAKAVAHPHAPVPAKPAAAPKPVAKPAAKPVAKPVAKPAPAGTVARPGHPVKPAVAGKPVPAAAKEASRKGGGYTILVGEYVVDSSLPPVRAKLRRLGLTPVKKERVRREETMNRLFLASYDDHAAAAAALDQLKKKAADAFILPENGKYSVYAGSYFFDWRAAVIQDKLYDNGVKTVMRKGRAAVQVTRLLAGSYPTKEEAQKKVALLKKHGISGRVIKAGK